MDFYCVFVQLDHFKK